MAEKDDEYWAKQRQRRADIEERIVRALAHYKNNNLALCAQAIADVIDLQGGFSKDYGRVPAWFNRWLESEGKEPLG